MPAVLPGAHPGRPAPPGRAQRRAPASTPGQVTAQRVRILYAPSPHAHMASGESGALAADGQAPFRSLAQLILCPVPCRIPRRRALPRPAAFRGGRRRGTRHGHAFSPRRPSHHFADRLRKREWSSGDGGPAGLYTEPVYYALAGQGSGQVAVTSPAHAKALKGHKTDAKDSLRLAEVRVR